LLFLPIAIFDTPLLSPSRRTQALQSSLDENATPHDLPFLLKLRVPYSQQK
jgi:hypothetical protein